LLDSLEMIKNKNKAYYKHIPYWCVDNSVGNFVCLARAYFYCLIIF
jgi:hypothetical protein